MKKRRQRQWFFPIYEGGMDFIKEEGILPQGAIAFDEFNAAYAYAAANRLTPIRDEEGELILNEQGLAQLPNLGRVVVLEISGKDLDWKKVQSISSLMHLRGMKENRDAIQIPYDLKISSHVIKSVKEETEDYYEKAMVKAKDKIQIVE